MVSLPSFPQRPKSDEVLLEELALVVDGLNEIIGA
jgi:hypothetical protein